MTIHSQMKMQRIELAVNLGCSVAERGWPQTVHVDVTVQFPNVLKGCETDQLEDTFCYNEFINLLHEYVAKREFQLIEFLAAYIYDFAKAQLSSSYLIRVDLLKYPAVKGLTGGVSFSYGDELK